MPPAELQPVAASSPAAAAVPLAASLEDVAKVYGSFAALRHVTLHLPVGSATVVRGDNGAGKSTLLRLFAGLLAPSRGAVLAFGADPRLHRGRIAYMSHESMLYDELSAIENLRYFARLHAGEHDCGCGGSPELALRAVGLDPALSRPVGQYSQGMRQRAALARVLQSDPELLLLDEPFSNVDAASARQMLDLLLDFRTWPVSRPLASARGSATLTSVPRGRTILLTTHQPQLAGSLAERTVHLRNGTVVSQPGDDADLPDAPAHDADPSRGRA